MSYLRKFIKRITHPFLKFGLNFYYRKPRNFCYEDICVKVHPEVFPPHLTFSTTVLLDFLKNIDLKDKSLLELGCGSGIIALYAAKKGAIVTATDINPRALQYLEQNAEQNQLSVRILYSNLFDELKNEIFDYIVINPPYYPKTPKNIKENAWFCGENFEYFEDLFFQIAACSSFDSAKIIMVLSEDCNISKIKEIAQNNEIHFIKLKEVKLKVEINYIYGIERAGSLAS